MANGKGEDVALMAHLLRRAGFGAPYEELEHYAAKGYEATVEELLHPESQPPLDDRLLMRLNMAWQDCFDSQPGLTFWLYRLVNTRRPLEEKVALFWHSVLCTGQAKVDHMRTMVLTIGQFRALGPGSFRDLLAATAQDPGMIYYLDNCMSHKGAINENWGRELLELFSMGVGNYSEQDVKEVARAFTGWTNAPPFPVQPYGRGTWRFFYDPTDHDDGEKEFLGQKGRLNGDDTIDIICQQPATARFIARHMYDFFVADEPPVPQWHETPPRDPVAIDTLVQAYFDCHYDIRSMLRTLFTSDFFKKARFTKIKSPAELVVGTARLVKDFAFPEPRRLIELVRLCGYMGQELYNPPSVEGWHTSAEWVDSGTLLERVNFLCSELGDVTKPGVREISRRLGATGGRLTPEDLVEGCVEQLGGLALSVDTRQDLVESARRGGPVNTGGEEFTKRTAAMLRVIAATKEYQFN